MATYAEIRAEVYRIVEDRVAVVDAGVQTHVQRAQVAIESRCAFPVQRAQTTLQVRTASTSYAKPTDFLAMRERPYYLETADSKRYIFLREAYSFEEMGLVDTQGAPKYWRDADDANLEFWPIGDANGPSVVTPGAYDVVIPYFKKLTTLSADEDENWWSINLSDVLAWRAAAFVFAELRDPMANWWSSVAAARFMEIRNQDRRNLLRQRETRIYPAESLSSSTQGRNRWRRRTWISDIP